MAKRSTKKRSNKKKKTALPWWKYVYLTVKYTFYGLYIIFRYLIIGIYWIFTSLYKGVRWIIVTSKKRTYRVQSEKQPKGARTTQKKVDNEEYQPFQVIETLRGSYETFESFITESKSTIGLILGARGTGKSTIGMRILENIHAKKNRSCYAMGFDPQELPKWIKNATTIDEIENDAIVLIDEGGILFSSRDAMKGANKILSELLLVARHKDLSILFITQNSSNLEVNVIRQADYLVLKPSSLLQKDFERKKIKTIYDEIAQKYERHKEIKGITYIYSEQFRGFVTNDLPSFWNEKLSKSFSGE